MTSRNRLNVHIYPSTFRFESRMLKTTRSALDSGAIDEVLIIARWEPGLDEDAVIDDHRRVRRLRSRARERIPGVVGRLVGLIEWQVRAAIVMIRARPAVVNPHSLPVLPAAVVTRVFTRARIIYDTHELESETMGASAVRRRVGRLLERAFVPMCAAIVVVNNSIGEWYRQRHPRARVVVVRNVPPRTFVPDAPSTRLRDLCGVPVDHLLFLYQGTIGEGRAVGLVLDVFERAAPDRHVVFLGYGELEDDVRRVAASHSNVHFLPGVAPSDLLDYTSSADVGLCLIENRCLSYYLSLPNKLFEYIVAGVPVIVSAFPEMTEIVESTGSGWAIPVRADDLERLVGSLDRPEVERRAAAARTAGGSLTWETEALPLIDLYRDVVRS